MPSWIYVYDALSAWHPKGVYIDGLVQDCGMSSALAAVTHIVLALSQQSLIARFMGPTWGPSGADRTQVGPMLAPWTLLSRMLFPSWLTLIWFVVKNISWLFHEASSDATIVLCFYHGTFCYIFKNNEKSKQTRQYIFAWLTHEIWMFSVFIDIQYNILEFRYVNSLFSVIEPLALPDKKGLTLVELW